jgi:anti-anti-sigma factor
LNITLSQEFGSTVIRISGSIDALTSDEAQTFFDKQINNTQTCLVIDLSQVDYLSSAGMRVLISAMKNARLRGGNLYLAGLRDNVHQVLNLAGFTSIFKIFPTVDEAAHAFAK